MAGTTLLTLAEWGELWPVDPIQLHPDCLQRSCSWDMAAPLPGLWSLAASGLRDPGVATETPEAQNAHCLALRESGVHPSG